MAPLVPLNNTNVVSVPLVVFMFVNGPPSMITVFFALTFRMPFFVPLLLLKPVPFVSM